MTIGFTLLALCGCQTRIDWPINRPPPTLNSNDIESLPNIITVSDVLKRFGAGMPDPNANMGMTYQRSGGGEYIFTWCPTAEVPGEAPAAIHSEKEMRPWRILAIFEVDSEQAKLQNRLIYVYPQKLEGKRFSGWQGGPKWEETK